MHQSVPRPPEGSPSTKTQSRQATPPRTDVGTILLHWTTAIALVVSLFTGVRIAADAISAPVSKWLSPILPQGHIFWWHFVFGWALFFCASAYVVYLTRTGLAARNDLQRVRLLTIPSAGKMRFEGANVLLHWVLYTVVLVLTFTGIFLYIGFGNWWSWVHSTVAFVALGWIFLHVVTHYLQGGWWQIFRVFRPAKLVLTQAVRPKPLLAATVVGAVVAAAVAGIDWASRDTLTIVRVDTPPVLDGDMSDPVWAKAKPVFIRTQLGVNFENNSGESTVEVRAVRDADKLYFVFKWDDPTRSLRRVPMIKKEDGWHVVDERTAQQDVVDYYEDKISIIFSDNPSLGGSGATGLGPNPLPDDKPRPLNERGFHYTTDGSYLDMWQWKASRGGLLGRVDDQWIGPPYEPSATDKVYQSRYQGGYWNDPGHNIYSYNYKFFPKGSTGPVEVIRLPKDWKKTLAQLGKFDFDPNSSDDENSRWNMFLDETQPYSKEADALIPVGTVMPGVILSGDNEGDRADLTGSAKWKDGYWTLELTRKLKTDSDSKYDKQFTPDKPLYMWVAVFDHVQTRHTWHSRAVRVITEP